MSMDAPDVLGMAWEEAEALLEEAGWSAAPAITRPPGAPPLPDELLRVIRVRAHQAERRLDVVLAPERFLSGKDSGAPGAR